ncbi:protein CONSERVED ONLY IN THE GREEN LINEAGE 160, chloroplastic [Abrus precatorius]|uniref:Protein CONSERVED ONLY IN THE GREEN LINEAGE 160, chloroplastic n=1 Tax=Abrus precatorius TaxID=3816 RepID=A0A8B8KP39_ABRPR|nr:protein CONSERVED ONLY IN THE GREEN LINEAGE 160, chloroplastic [Abrus precatorius]
MAIVNNICVSCAATPMSPESSGSAPLPDPKQTKIILPKKKPMKWSTGVAPGDYGGPPTTTKLRKYWGGQDEDPLASDDFMWNKDFVGRFKKLIQEPQPPLQPSPPKEEPSGFLSLNRVMSLDSLEVDLSKELSAPANNNVHQQIEAKTDVTETASNRVKWKLVPTRREQEKWDRAAKAATGGSDVMFQEIRRSREDPKVLAAQSEEQYAKLKRKLQFLTLGIGGIGLVSAYVSYSPEIAASFGAGLLGSLMYIRMLGSSVDSLKTDGAKGLVKGAIGQPRLLVPVALVMIYNRWNAILVPEFGSMHLELIPMLVGFFTYKIATFAQAVEDAITVAAKKT